MNQQQKKLGKTISFINLLASVLILNPLAWAHKKVVVIPLAGDDVVETIEPFNPVTANTPSSSDYILNTNTIMDKVTKLEWQRIDFNTVRNWDEALVRCRNLNIGGQSDWRLPEIDELQSIIDYEVNFGPNINGVAFPSSNSTFFFSASIYKPGSFLIFFWGGAISKMVPYTPVLILMIIGFGELDKKRP